MLIGDTYLQGTAFPGDSLSTSTFWFPRLLLLCVPTFFLLLSQRAESTAPTLRAGGQSRILLTVSFWLQTGQEKASTCLHRSAAGGSPLEPSGGEQGQWSRGGGRQVWRLVGSRSIWKESPGAEKNPLLYKHFHSAERKYQQPETNVISQWGEWHLENMVHAWPATRFQK